MSGVRTPRGLPCFLFYFFLSFLPDLRYSVTALGINTNNQLSNKMSGRGKSGKGLGKGGAKRHRKVLRDNIQVSFSSRFPDWVRSAHHHESHQPPPPQWRPHRPRTQEPQRCS